MLKLNNITKKEHTSSIHAILAEADKYRGVPYVFGEFTSSGFTSLVVLNVIFAETKVSLVPRLADEQYNVGVGSFSLQTRQARGFGINFET